MDFHLRGDHRERARAFAAEVIAPSVISRDRASRWDSDIFRHMGQAGLLGAALPEAYGGGGQRASDVGQLQVGFGEGAGDAGLALAWSAHSFGCALPIQYFGSETQKRRFLPGLARGTIAGALAHIETHTPGDPIGVRTCAMRAGRRWLLRGTKPRVVNGSVADLFIVTAITDPTRGSDGISTFLVERGARGLVIGRRTETLGARTATISEVRLQDCEISDDNRLGPENAGLSQVYRLIQRWERACQLAPWVGLLQSLVEHSISHAREHAEYGRPLSQSQSLRATLADMRIRVELCRRLHARAAWHLDNGDPAADRDIAIARLYLGESITTLTQGALRIHGPSGVEIDHLAERLYRDAMVVNLLGGGSDVLRSIVAGSLLDMG